MKKILNLKLEEPTLLDGKIKDAKIQEAQVKGQTKHRLQFTVVDPRNGNELVMSDAWLQSRTGSKDVKTLWINPQATHISKNSNLGQVMDYYNKEAIEDFIDSEIQMFPDRNNYLVIASCPISKDDLNHTLKKEDFYK